MSDAQRMSFVECVRDLNGVSKGFIERQRSFGETFGECFPFEKFHNEEVDSVVMAQIVEDADVWVIEARYRLCFALKSLLELRLFRKMRGQNLYCNRAPETRILRLIHLSHSTHANRMQDFIRTQFGSGGNSHLARRLQQSGCRKQRA